MRACIAAAAVLLASGAAHADDGARRAYIQGDFLQAAATADSGALAARALIAEALTGEDADVAGLLARAAAQARAGLGAEPSSVDARLQLALALGLQARRAPLKMALRAGYAREGRRLINEALMQAPRNAWAHALDGAWHLEVLRRGGAAGASLFGARRSVGIAAYERARALAPNDAAIATMYAVALLELDGTRSRTRAAGLLNAAGACSGDALQVAMAREARMLSSLLAREGVPATIARATRRLRPA
jgi:hypothetical protein